MDAGALTWDVATLDVESLKQPDEPDVSVGVHHDGGIFVQQVREHQAPFESDAITGDDATHTSPGHLQAVSQLLLPERQP